jgi:glycine cleavage system H protein
MAHIPEELRYAKTHEWVRVEGDTATVGISDYAQGELGDVVFVDLPQSGTSLSAGDAFGSIESVKSVSDLYAPVGGEVVEVNGTLEENPEKVNEDPYGEGWLIKIRASGEGDLLSAAEYEQFIEEEG